MHTKKLIYIERERKNCKRRQIKYETTLFKTQYEKYVYSIEEKKLSQSFI